MLTHEKILADMMRLTVITLAKSMALFEGAANSCRSDEQDCAVEELERAVEAAQDALDAYRMAQVFRRHRRIEA